MAHIKSNSLKKRRSVSSPTVVKSKKIPLTNFKHKQVLITGGLGFIGSNIAIKLVKFGARVTIIDNLNPLYGGNIFNISDIKHNVTLIIGDVRDKDLIHKHVEGKDFIFHLAAQVSYIDSAALPYDDLDINCKSYLHILEGCKAINPQAKIVYSSSRMALGRTASSINSLSNNTVLPLNLYGIHKLTSEKYSHLYHTQFGLRTTVLRLTNPYGDRQQIKHSKYSIPGWFMRQAMENNAIKIFGDGSQKRDYIHINDLVNAFLLAAISPNTDGKVYDCGYGKSIFFRDMVNHIIAVVRKGKVEYIPWPENYTKVETGDSEISISELSKDTHWEPTTDILKGLRQMYKYYKKHYSHYTSSK